MLENKVATIVPCGSSIVLESNQVKPTQTNSIQELRSNLATSRHVLEPQTAITTRNEGSTSRWFTYHWHQLKDLSNHHTHLWPDGQWHWHWVNQIQQHVGWHVPGHIIGIVTTIDHGSWFNSVRYLLCIYEMYYAQHVSQEARSGINQEGRGMLLGPLHPSVRSQAST